MRNMYIQLASRRVPKTFPGSVQSLQYGNMEATKNWSWGRPGNDQGYLLHHPNCTSNDMHQHQHRKSVLYLGFTTNKIAKLFLGNV